MIESTTARPDQDAIEAACKKYNLEYNTNGADQWTAMRTAIDSYLATLPTAWAVIAPGEHPKAEDVWDDKTQALSYAGMTGLLLQRVVIVPGGGCV